MQLRLQALSGPQLCPTHKSYLEASLRTDQSHLPRRALHSPGKAHLDPGHRNNGVPLPSARASKKHAQISALVLIVAALLSDSFKDAAGQIFDLCGGCGHTALVLAYALPSCRVTLVEANETALSVAASRAAAARIYNFATLNVKIETLRP